MPVLRLSHPAHLDRKLDRFWNLPAEDRWRLLQAALGLPVNAAGLRLIGFRRWGAYLARATGDGGRGAAGGRAPERGTSPAGFLTAQETWRLVQWAVSYGPYAGNCLSRSLTLWWLLRRQGLDSDLRIGVSKLAGRFQAHAWIEYQGIVVNDRPDVRERYGVFEWRVTHFD